MNEHPLMMLVHGAILGIVAYVLMRYFLKQSEAKAMTRSVLFGLLVATYMIVFGHKMPTSINRNL
jgi:hypothetical protein